MDYSVYLLNDDGHVFAREDIIAKNDEETCFSSLNYKRVAISKCGSSIARWR
jgi:hypothetical protein